MKIERQHAAGLRYVLDILIDQVRSNEEVLNAREGIDPPPEGYISQDLFRAHIEDDLRKIDQAVA